MQRGFEALASSVRRQILADLARTELSVGDSASRLKMRKPSISQHLSILEAARLVTSNTTRGQYVVYRRTGKNLVNTLNGFLQEACPVSRPLRRESAARAATREPTPSTKEV